MNRGIQLACLLCLLLTGCAGSSSLSSAQDSVEPISGSNLHGLSVMSNGDEISICAASVPAAGYYFRLPQTTELAATSETWENDSDLLHLAIPTASGIEIGIVPLPDYNQEPVAATLSLDATPRHTSIPPHAGDNQELLEEVFEVEELAQDTVWLKWTQVNIGDYDFNGEVSITDLTPVAVNYLHTVDDTLEDPTLQPVYWVDGDRNGEINAQDLVPLAMHYGSQVDGYIVSRNGDVLEIGSPENPDVLRDREIRPNLPPLYSEIVTGSSIDVWNVTPVDADGQAGSDLDQAVTELAVVKAQVSFSGATLFDLDGSGQISSGSGNSVLRIVDPGEIVDRAEVGRGVEDDPGVYFFYGIPRDTLLYLDVLYYPKYDPATGEERTGQPIGVGNPIPVSELTITSIPFVLKTATPIQRLSLEIKYEPNPEGGYYTSTTPAYDPPSSLFPATTARLDVTQGLVSWDVDGTGLYEFNPALDDPDFDSISTQRRSQLDYYLAFTKPAPALASLTGRVAEFDLANGTVELYAPIAATAYQTFTLPNTTVQFSETANFKELMSVSGSLLEREFEPSTLAEGDEVVLEVDLLGGDQPSQWQAIWLRNLTRLVPEI